MPSPEGRLPHRTIGGRRGLLDERHQQPLPAHYDPFGNATQAQPQLKYLTSLQADWRYVIPDATGGGTHPVLYASGDGGVFRSLDDGTTWTSFPDQSFDVAPVDGGYLPNAQRHRPSCRSASRPDHGPGRGPGGRPEHPPGQHVRPRPVRHPARPVVFPTTIALDTRLPAPGGSVSGTDPNGLPIVKVAQPVIDGCE